MNLLVERIADELEDANYLHGNGWSDATPQLREWAERIRKLAKECEHATENLIKLKENGKSGLEKDGRNNSHESSKSV